MKKRKILFPFCFTILMGISACNRTTINPKQCKHENISLSSDEYEHYQICNDCGKIIPGSEAVHDFQVINNVTMCTVCGRKKYSDGGGGSCEHHYVYMADDQKHWQVCEICGEETARRYHSYSTNTSKITENKEATCTEDGWEWQICKCGKERIKIIAALGHNFTVITSTTSTCTEDGYNTMKCSRCETVSEDTVAQEALGHNLVDDPTYVGLEPTCEGCGTKKQVCNRPGCDYYEIQEVPPLGHDYIVTDVDFQEGYAGLNTEACSRGYCNVKRYSWDAREVTDDCKYNRRLAKEAVEDDPLTAENESHEAVYEPNYIEEDDGSVRFWGRPIHNACILDDGGKAASQRAATPVYDASVEGSHFEYKINLPSALYGVRLVMYMQPTPDLGTTGDLFRSNPNDWTPGLIDSVDNKEPYRYVLTIDDKRLDLDDNGYGNPSPGSYKNWFTFPTEEFRLSAGEHKIRITMAGGYFCNYYRFGFEGK